MRAKVAAVETTRVEAEAVLLPPESTTVDQGTLSDILVM